MTAARLPSPDTATRLPLAQWDGVAVRYPYAERDAVGPVSHAVAPGERLLLLGPSGSGKSTLLWTLTGIVPQTVPATVRGSVRVGGMDVVSRPPAGWADAVAQLFQDAEHTLTGLRVADEIAFALENQGLPEAEIETRIRAVMAQVGLPEGWRDRRTSTLSGGEKQMVGLAATLVTGAPLFVADEPTASLAPAVARRVYDLVLGNPGCRGVLIVDHRLDAMIGAIDRIAVLDNHGALVAEGAPGAVFRAHGDSFDAQGIWTPLASRFDRALVKAGLAATRPLLTMEQLGRCLADLPAGTVERACAVIAETATPMLPARRRRPGASLVRLHGAACAPLFGPIVLRDVTMDIGAGEVVGIVGTNGAGKSTLGASLAGLLRLKGGQRDGPPGAIAFQNPENQFLEANVHDELAAALPKDAGKDRIAGILGRWGLSDVVRQHPYELSQGQKRRLALACLTTTDRWPLLVLDEPTSGLDARGAKTIAGAINALADDGRAIAIITHDMDFALAVCDRLVVIADGGVAAEGTPLQVLRDANLLARADLAPPAILPLLDWMDRVTC